MTNAEGWEPRAPVHPYFLDNPRIIGEPLQNSRPLRRPGEGNADKQTWAIVPERPQLNGDDLLLVFGINRLAVIECLGHSETDSSLHIQARNEQGHITGSEIVEAGALEAGWSLRYREAALELDVSVVGIRLALGIGGALPIIGGTGLPAWMPRSEVGGVNFHNLNFLPDMPDSPGTSA